MIAEPEAVETKYIFRLDSGEILIYMGRAWNTKYFYFVYFLAK